MILRISNIFLVKHVLSFKRGHSDAGGTQYGSIETRFLLYSIVYSLHVFLKPGQETKLNHYTANRLSNFCWIPQRIAFFKKKNLFKKKEVFKKQRKSFKKNHWGNLIISKESSKSRQQHFKKQSHKIISKKTCWKIPYEMLDAKNKTSLHNLLESQKLSKCPNYI